MFDTEKERVMGFSKTADYAHGIMTAATQYCGNIFCRYMKPEGSVLELGPAEGVMTDELYPLFSDYTVVDGADFFIENLKRRYPKIEGHACLFEDFHPTRQYDTILLGHVLEHVENPINVLKLCKLWIKRGGRIISAVPNCDSIHRQVAVRMGILTSVDELGETDHRNGHRRVYNRARLKADFETAGLFIVKLGGYWLKPLTNAQLEQIFTSEMTQAFFELGEKYPEIAGEIYIVAEVK